MKLWIARDKDNSLCLHYEKPVLSESGVWYSEQQVMILPKNQYPEVTWGNSPQEVELKLINNEN